MATPSDTLIALERRFWQALVDEDSDAATQLLTEPALMVTEHGTFKFDHKVYRKMAAEGPVVVKSFQLSDMQVVFPNDHTAVLSYHVKQELTPRGRNEATTQEVNDTSTWIKDHGSWKCVMHTETPTHGAMKSRKPN
jgi:hypothetical protein